MYKKVDSKYKIGLFAAFSVFSLIVVSIGMITLKNLAKSEDYDKEEQKTRMIPTEDMFISKVITEEDQIEKPVVDGKDPVLGASNALITIVQYSDFTCKFCNNQEKIIKEVIDKYKGKVRMIWKDYPEGKVDSKSWQSAIAARCAESQRQFWNYHDFLFSGKYELNKDGFLKIAQDLKLNAKEFEICLKNELTSEQIRKNIKEANALNINGVPYLFVNDKEFMGEVEAQELDLLIQSELK